MNTLLRQRVLSARHQGAALLDCVYVTVSCKRCNRFHDDAEGRPIKSADYRDLDALIERARITAQQIFAEPAGVCRQCGWKTHVVAVDYHAWHTTAQRDLVVRATRRPFVGL